MTSAAARRYDQQANEHFCTWLRLCATTLGRDGRHAEARATTAAYHNALAAQQLVTPTARGAA